MDIILAGRQAGGQVRERVADGSVLRYNYKPTPPVIVLPPSPSMPTPASQSSQPSTSSGDDQPSNHPQPYGSKSRGERARSRGPDSGKDRTSSAGPPPPPYLKRPARPSDPRGGYPEPSAASPFAKSGFGASSSPWEGNDAAPQEGSYERSSFGGGGATASYVTEATAGMLRLFPYELDDDNLWETIQIMGAMNQVHIATSLEEADAVLALR